MEGKREVAGVRYRAGDREGGRERWGGTVIR